MSRQWDGYQDWISLLSFCVLDRDSVFWVRGGGGRRREGEIIFIACLHPLLLCSLGIC